ncbi:MAG: LamG-like jellyroll fold domain-containing protein [Phycisphaerae bacterium]
MPKPFVIDSSGNRCDIEFDLSGEGLLKLIINPEWLKTATYPIIIDPTIYVCDAALYRGSTAHKLDGTFVDYSVPRYETGRFGQAIMVETGTINLLTANQSSEETNLTGFDSDGQYGGQRTLTRDSSAQAGWHGSASAKLTSNYSGTQWITIRTFPVLRSISPSTVYTASVYTKANVAGKTQSLTIKWYDSSGSLVPPLTGDSSGSTSETNWQRVSVTATSPTDAAKAALELRIENVNQNDALWWDGAQLEQKPYATSWFWATGDPSRAAESLTIPTTGIFKKNSWTTELTYKPICPANESQRKTLWRVNIDTNNYYSLTVETDGAVKLTVCGNGTQYSISTESDYIDPGDIYSIMAAGNESVIRLCINGEQIGSDVYYIEPTGNLPARMSLGCNQTSWLNCTEQADGLLDNVRFSNIAHTKQQHQGVHNQLLPINSDTTFKDEFDGNPQGLASGLGGTGIESYWNYVDLDLRGGWTASINTFNSNLVLHKTLFTIPGRGLPMQESITYNSTAEGTGWQLASGTRISELSELQNGDVILTDTDGSSHTFTYNSGNYIAPPGIYLTLHKESRKFYNH